MDHTLRTSDLDQSELTHRVKSGANLPKPYVASQGRGEGVDVGGNHNARYQNDLSNGHKELKNYKIMVAVPDLQIVWPLC